ncbi:myotubularin-like protein [Plasmopara halstedii]|uniref:Myotubularin-like protein n=1 Tax=Plasmopara halstedii TaxID=4781 RepID=A0A0P1B840_PLAHL|nr:myotubularin-like protein [Plasmopara halstedii]CEG50408.1 myotubularin-like protein [Plasmopara halstedii]|eukprot:XP_024586777.1 myotubularin-like protein [Plasmopara halstedii]
MGDDVARLDVLRDPKRMAALLARALSTSILEDTTNASAARRGSIEEEDEEVEKTQEEFQELGRRSGAEASGKNSSLNLMIQSAVDDDDDDAGEEDEEDEDEEKPLDEVELEAAAAALQTAARIVEQLRIKKALQTSQTTGNLQFNLEELMSVSLQRAQTNPLATGNGPGVPMPQALLRTNSTCCGCSKSFNPFHRSKSCASCGYAFCPRCSSKSFVLPTRFGYGEELMRTCDLCARWYQNALDRYFEAMELVTDQDHNSAIHRDSVIRENCPSVSSNSIIDPTPSAIKEIGSLVARRRFSVSSPTPVPCDEIVDDSCDNEDQLITSVSTTSFKRRHRFSSMSSSPSVNRTKPWFSGHLRAIHVNDRLPRKRRARGDSEGGETVNNSPNLLSQQSRSSSVTSSKSRYIDESAHDTRGQRTYLVENSPIDLQDGAYVVGASQSSHIKGKEPRLTTSEKPVVETVCTNSTRPQRKTRSKFSRSASFDLTNLHAAVSPISSLESPGMARSNTFGSDEGKMFALDVGSNGSGRSNSLRSQKAFDDSDIVDERAKLDSADVKLKSEAKLSAAVLRFAVYEMGGKESTGLRRTFGFAKANPVLDRYTLEFDCRQRIVRAKSVFLHRFWSFHCDSVQSFSFGTSDGMAHLIIFNGGQGNLSLKLKFANDDEREQFKQALDSCRSTTLERIREFATRNAMSLPAWPECPASPALDDIHSPTPPEPNTTYSANASTTVESELSLTHDTNCSITADFPMLQSIHVPLLPGEAVVKDTELQATLLIGPASETYESAQAEAT